MDILHTVFVYGTNVLRQVGQVESFSVEGTPTALTLGFTHARIDCFLLCLRDPTVAGSFYRTIDLYNCQPWYLAL